MKQSRMELYCLILIFLPNNDDKSPQIATITCAR